MAVDPSILLSADLAYNADITVIVTEKGGSSGGCGTCAQPGEGERQRGGAVQRQQPPHGPREGRLAVPAHGAPEGQAGDHPAQLLRQHLPVGNVIAYLSAQAQP